jgi:hypothetical protein
LKRSTAIFVLTLFSVIANAQTDSAYKYTYTFMLDEPKGKSKVSIDSSFNMEDTSFEIQTITSIKGEVKDAANKPISFASIYLYSADTVVWHVIKPAAVFDRPLQPGSYRLSVGAIGYKPFAYNFSIGRKATMHFDVVLAPAASNVVYEIHSKIKLTKEDINGIKKCVAGNDELECSKKDVYYVWVQI